MKIKLGFVSNSSSASFCVWGVEFNADNGEDENYLPEEVLKRSYQYYLDNNKDGGFYHDRPTAYRTNNDIKVIYEFFCQEVRKFNYDFTEYIVGYLGNCGLDSIFSSESECCVVGNSPFDLDENKTIKECKESIKKSFEEAGFDKDNIYLSAICEEVNT